MSASKVANGLGIAAGDRETVESSPRSVTINFRHPQHHELYDSPVQHGQECTKMRGGPEHSHAVPHLPSTVVGSAAVETNVIDTAWFGDRIFDDDSLYDEGHKTPIGSNPEYSEFGSSPWTGPDDLDDVTPSGCSPDSSYSSEPASVLEPDEGCSDVEGETDPPLETTYSTDVVESAGKGRGVVGNGVSCDGEEHGSDTIVTHSDREPTREKTKVVFEGLDAVIQNEEESNADVLAAMESFRRGDYHEAVGLFTSALQSKVALLGSKHEHVSLIREKLGDVSVKMGRHHDAERHYNVALRNLQANIGSVNEDVGRVYASQGDLYHKMGKHLPALKCYKKSLSVRRELLVTDRQAGVRASMGASNIMHSAGIIHARRGSFESACSLFSQLLSGDGRDAEAAHNVPYVLNSIGNIRFKQGEYGQAIKYYKKSLKGHLDVGRTRGHADVCGTISNLGRAYFSNDEYDRAIECLMTAVKLFQKVGLRRSEMEVGAILTKLGSAYFKKKDYERAMEFYIKSLKEKHVLLKDDSHPSILITRHDIGLVLCKQGRFDDAMNVFEDIKMKRIRAGETDSPDFAKLLVDMSSVYLKRGGEKEVEKADDLCDSAIHILLESNVRESHPYVRQVRDVVRQIYSRSRRHMDEPVAPDIDASVSPESTNPYRAPSP